MNGQGTIVVTGGAGLIGSAVIWGLNNRKLEDIWLVDEWEDLSQKQETSNISLLIKPLESTSFGK